MSLKFILALALLVFVFWFVGIGELITALSQVDLLYIFYLLLLAVVMIWASCMKWQLFLRARGHEVEILHLMRLYTIGYFFNSFTPSYVGGDIARSYQLGLRLGSQKDAFIATFLERFTGVVAMASLGLLFVLIGTKATAGVETAIVIVGAGVAFLAFACFHRRFGDICFSVGSGSIRKIGLTTLSQKLEKLYDKVQKAVDYARSDRKLLVKAMIWSYVFHFLTVVNTYVAARAVGWESPDFAGLFVVVPLVLLVSMAPITPNGLGLQEGAFLFFLQRVGGTRGQSLGIGVVLRAKVLLIALCGWALWIALKKREVEASNVC